MEDNYVIIVDDVLFPTEDNLVLNFTFTILIISGCAGVVIGHDQKSCGYARVGSNPTIDEKEIGVVVLICVYVLSNIVVGQSY